MFDRTEIVEKLTDYIVEEFEIEEDDDFDGDVHLFDYGYVDSFGAVEIMSFIEKTFGVEITNKDLIMYPMNTINEIAEVIEMKVK
ncbi:acyl carrier protein [Gottschalkia purinilytica]|uniref:Acyl carrier protein n=1 Tax=Gottschalkia purinilytica TaxID=1503 RepID=A0A0L0WA00_GOTPU|nr:acyl carrier protein [Gottschalkia purinilytica]KNF08359.1 acyl carrier protein [Gottschalkia purinilytica]